MAFTVNIQFTQDLFSSILDLFNKNGSGTSHATFNVVQLPRNISGKTFQNLVNRAVELFHVHREDKRYFCIFVSSA